MKKIICHIDFDYFFAQCEEIRSPELKTKLVMVCVYSGRNNDSGVIATSNYAARKYNVQSGMPIKLAKRILANVQNSVFLPIDYKYYSYISSHTMKIIQKYTDIFEYAGIDEAYLDLTNESNTCFEKVLHIVQQIKNEILENTSLTCSIGIAHNKLISKLASNYRKPDGLTIIKPENVSNFLSNIKITDLPGIGSKTAKKISQVDAITINQLKKINIFTLNSLFGKKFSTYIYNIVRGIDYSDIRVEKPTSQFSKMITLKYDSVDYYHILKNVKSVCKELHSIIISNNKMFRNIVLHCVQMDLTNKIRSKNLPQHTDNYNELEKTTIELLQDILVNQNIKIRRIGIKVSKMTTAKQYSITSFF